MGLGAIVSQSPIRGGLNMATRISDIIVPEIFTGYTQQLTEQKSRVIASGAAERNSTFDQFLNGGGLTFNVPSFQDLADDDDNVASDDPDQSSTPKKVQTSQEVQVRLSRNQSWKTMDLASALSGADPAEAVAQRVSTYWARRAQAAFLATVQGVFADNAAAPAGSEHVVDDMTNDISGLSFGDGITNFSAAAFLDTTLTMGDSMEDLSLMMVHSVVFNRMQKLNLIDYILDATDQIRIPTYLNREVIVDDSVPAAGGIYETLLFGRGAIQLGMGAPEVPTEVDRDPDSGNGSGSECLYSRVEWVIHPVGCAYVGTSPVGGPSNASTSNNLASAGSWQRVFPERKQIKIARLITREA